MNKERIKARYSPERPEPAEYTGENGVIDQAADPKKAGKGIKATGEEGNTEFARGFILGRPYGGK